MNVFMISSHASKFLFKNKFDKQSFKQVKGIWDVGVNYFDQKKIILGQNTPTPPHNPSSLKTKTL